jgi:hypothetical protein
MKKIHHISESELDAYFEGNVSPERSIEIKKYLLEELILKQQQYAARQVQQNEMTDSIPEVLKNLVSKAAPTVVAPTKVVPLFTRFHRARAASVALLVVGAGWLVWQLLPEKDNLVNKKTNAEVKTEQPSGLSADMAAPRSPTLPAPARKPDKIAASAPPKELQMAQNPKDTHRKPKKTKPFNNKQSGDTSPIAVSTNRPESVNAPILTPSTLKGHLSSGTTNQTRLYLDTVLLKTAFLDTLNGSDSLKNLRKQFNENLDQFKQERNGDFYSYIDDLSAAAVSYEDKFAVALCNACSNDYGLAARLLRELAQTKDLSVAQVEEIHLLLKTLDALIAAEKR